MQTQIELSSLDLKYETCRIRSRHEEKRLQDSILERGIREPLQGVEGKDGRLILLDGFKRVRCARKLNIAIAPWQSLGDEAWVGIAEILRRSTARSLTILEQARLIDELQKIHQLTCGDIALLLEKSKGWVSMRSGMIRKMSRTARDQIFKGRFPAYAYMYILRSFMRMNKVTGADVDEFILSVAGKELSIREIELLAHGWFKGPPEVRSQIAGGDPAWVVDQMKTVARESTGCTGAEQKAIHTLEILQSSMQKALCHSRDDRLSSASFKAIANQISEDILNRMPQFSQSMRRLYDQTRQTQSDLPSA